MRELLISTYVILSYLTHSFFAKDKKYVKKQKFVLNLYFFLNNVVILLTFDTCMTIILYVENS